MGNDVVVALHVDAGKGPTPSIALPGEARFAIFGEPATVRYPDGKKLDCAEKQRDFVASLISQRQERTDPVTFEVQHGLPAAVFRFWPSSRLPDIVMLDARRNRVRNMDGGPESRQSLWLFLKNARSSLALWIGAYSAFGLFAFLARGHAVGVWASALVLSVATASLLVSWHRVARGQSGPEEPPTR